MKKLSKLALSAIISGITVMGCNLPNSEAKYSKLYIGFEFPKIDSDFNLKIIPQETQSILLTIEGNGLTDKIEQRFIREGSSNRNIKKVIENVPLGNKKITAEAFDKESRLIATDTKQVDIGYDPLYNVELDLEVLFQDVRIILDRFPADTNKVFMEIINKNNEKTIKEFDIAQAEFKIDHVPVGELKTRFLTVDSNQIPNSEVTQSFDINYYSNTFLLPLNQIEFPLQDDEINLSKNENLGIHINNINNTAPKSFTDFIEKSYIKFAENKVPSLESIKVKLNDLDQNFSLENKNIIKSNIDDILKINVINSDENNDENGFLWSIINDNTGVMNILKKENSKDISLKVPDIPGSYNLSFIISDGKSFSGPHSIPIHVFQD